MDWTEVGGASLRYELAGSGEQILLLVHEAGGALESWDECLPAFQAHFRTLRYDQRGFGLSEKIPGPLSIDHMVADIAGLLDGLSIQTCHAAGSAMGAGIVAAFAARHPQRIDRLVLQSPATGANPQFRSTLLARADGIEQAGMRAHAAASLDRSYPHALRTNQRRYERYRMRWIANDPHSYAAINRMGITMQLEPELGRIGSPTLIIGCRQDPLRPPEMMRPLAHTIPRARYVEADSGHFMAVQSPQLFTEIALPFLLSARNDA
jgi:3-oxoadipate enol-lactonase